FALGRLGGAVARERLLAYASMPAHAQGYARDWSLLALGVLERGRREHEGDRWRPDAAIGAVFVSLAPMGTTDIGGVAGGSRAARGGGAAEPRAPVLSPRHQAALARRG